MTAHQEAVTATPREEVLAAGVLARQFLEARSYKADGNSDAFHERLGFLIDFLTEEPMRSMLASLTAAREALEAKERECGENIAKHAQAWVPVRDFLESIGYSGGGVHSHGPVFHPTYTQIGFQQKYEPGQYMTMLAVTRHLHAAKEAAEQRAATAEAALAGVREWIPVDERLPEDGVEVLANWPLSDTVRILVCERGNWFIPDWVEDELALTAPTHWRPLPAPPSSGSPAEGA